MTVTDDLNLNSVKIVTVYIACKGGGDKSEISVWSLSLVGNSRPRWV